MPTRIKLILINSLICAEVKLELDPTLLLGMSICLCYHLNGMPAMLVVITMQTRSITVDDQDNSYGDGINTIAQSQASCL